MEHGDGIQAETAGDVGPPEAGGAEDKLVPGAGAEAGVSTTTIKSRSYGPGLIDGGIKDQLSRAASAIGLSLEEMINLVVDSGMVALPPSDAITHTFTMEDLGKRMWNLLNQQPTSKKAEWFASLAPAQQKSLLVTLRHNNVSAFKLSEELDLHIMDINRVWNEYADDIGAQVVGTRLTTIAGHLQLVAERCMEGLAKDEAHLSVWKIQKELTGLLQNIGIVDRAAQRVEHSHVLKDERQAEIQKMIELEKKKQVRTEEIKRIDVTVLDAVPSLDAVEEMPF